MKISAIMRCKLILSLPIILLTVHASAHQFNVSSNVEYGISLPVETYKKMGITKGWFHVPLPVKLNKNGQPVWASEKEKAAIQKIYRKFENSGISIFLVIDIWRTYCKYGNNVNQKTFYGKKWSYCSFSAETKFIEKCLKFLIQELKTYKCFGGICLDDEPTFIAGGDYHEETIRLFKKKYRMSPPSREAFLNTKPGTISPSHPVLLWITFQQELLLNFYQKLAKAVQEIEQDCPIYTIPGASWICGKTISLPNSPPEKTKTYKLGTLDSCYMKDFHFYTQYALSILDKKGRFRKVAEGLCQAQFTPPNCPRNVVPIYHPDPEGKGISPVAFRRYVLQTFAEGAKGIDYWPINAFSEKTIQAADDLYDNNIKPICAKTPDLKKLKGRAGVLFSTSTAAFASVWRSNPIERFKHHHGCEALAYYFLKKGVPFDIIIEDELHNSRDLKDYRVIISTGLQYLNAKKVKLLERYIANGGNFILDKTSGVSIKGATLIDFNTEYWYETLKGRYQKESDLEYQAGLLDSRLRSVLPESLAICQSSSRHLNINYMTDGQCIYLFIVNNDLFGNIKSELTFNKVYQIIDVLSGQVFSKTKSMSISVPLGEIRVLKIKR